jgi:hypothetical protein
VEDLVQGALHLPPEVDILAPQKETVLMVEATLDQEIVMEEVLVVVRHPGELVTDTQADQVSPFRACGGAYTRELWREGKKGCSEREGRGAQRGKEGVLRE